jgi:hypothetical protein
MDPDTLTLHPALPMIFDWIFEETSISCINEISQGIGINSFDWSNRQNISSFEREEILFYCGPINSLSEASDFKSDNTTVVNIKGASTKTYTKQPVNVTCVFTDSIHKDTQLAVIAKIKQLFLC